MSSNLFIAKFYLHSVCLLSLSLRIFNNRLYGELATLTLSRLGARNITVSFPRQYYHHPACLRQCSAAAPLKSRSQYHIHHTCTAMEDFSQSRGDDDLFDDEIIPIEQSTSTEEVTKSLDTVTLDPPQAQAQAQPQPAAFQEQSQQQLPGPSSRGRGRGRGDPSSARGAIRGGALRQQAAHPARGGGHGLSESRWSNKPAATQQPSADIQEKKKTSPEEPTSTNTADPSTSPESTKASAAPTTEDAATADAPPSDAAPPPPTGPSSNSSSAAAKTTTTTTPTTRPHAVRGDRSSTGGFAKPKLTEEQLTAKLAAAKQKSFDRAAAHARAQADAEEFAERERLAGARRRKEEGERKRMEGEREKNRARKLGAQMGREWDKDKEELVGGGRGFAPRPRGGGGVNGEEQQDLSMYEWHDDHPRGNGRGGRGGGRGGRGRGGRGGRGAFRGGADAVNGGRFNPPAQQEPNVNAAEDFPALPPGAAGAKAAEAAGENAVDEQKMKIKKPPPPVRVDSDQLAPGKSWADQMET